MSAKKQNPRKASAKKLEPIDWREFANDAVLNGNMSTLYRRPATEDPSAYASAEAMVEIEKRVVRPVESAGVPEPDIPTVGLEPPVGSSPGVEAEPTVSPKPAVGIEPTPGPIPTAIESVGTGPTVGTGLPIKRVAPPRAAAVPAAGSEPPVGIQPAVGPGGTRRIKPIRDVQDALTLAGQVLYRAMLGHGTAGWSTSCTKGYRQLAAETYLDKDTVRDLIVEFKEKGIVRETATYDPDTRLAKTYEVLSYQAVLETWRESGLLFVTTGRQRPLFCSAQGDLLTFIPTVGSKPRDAG